MKFGLSENEFNLLKKLALDPLKQSGAKVWVFGSRSRGDHKKFSDIDLLFDFMDVAPPKGLLFEIKDSLENSNLSYKVDLVNKKEIAQSYYDNIQKDCQPI